MLFRSDDRGGGGGDPSANVGFQSDKLDASYHSPAWQEAHIKSLQDFKRPTLEEFKRAEKEREGKLQANAEATERETAAFRKQQQLLFALLLSPARLLPPP